MARPSTVDRLPAEVRAEIGRLRQNGRTLDEILAHLRKLDGIAPVSRSALGRHIQGMDKLGERIRRSRHVAEAMFKELGDAPESKAASLNIELAHTALLDLFMQGGDADGEVDADGKAALAGNPMGMMLVAKGIDHLASAAKKNADFAEKIEKAAEARAKRDAAATVERIGKESGISAATLDAIKAGIFGVKPPEAPRAE